MDAATRHFVRRRAGSRCEYCCMPQRAAPLLPFHVEHIIAQQHIDDDRLGNLALACDRCNAYKGPNLSSVDPETGAIVQLFHPRKELWNDHFLQSAGRVIGLTSKGRATVRLLKMNAARRVQLRRESQDVSGDSNEGLGYP